LFIAAGGLAAVIVIFSALLGQKGRRNLVKDTAYECGKPEITKPHTRFSVKFYLVAMLFILFDIEVVFLYPWAVVYREMLQSIGVAMLVEMVVFLGILIVGFIWIWKKGALDWNVKE